MLYCWKGPRINDLEAFINVGEKPVSGYLGRHPSYLMQPA